jgi:hypothetical protein
MCIDIDSFINSILTPRGLGAAGTTLRLFVQYFRKFSTNRDTRFVADLKSPGSLRTHAHAHALGQGARQNSSIKSHGVCKWSFCFHLLLRRADNLIDEESILQEYDISKYNAQRGVFRHGW